MKGLARSVRGVLQYTRAGRGGMSARIENYLGFPTGISGQALAGRAYVQAQKAEALPAHFEVEEFYLQSGALLQSTQAQRRYASLNYTWFSAHAGELGSARRAAGSINSSCTSLTASAASAPSLTPTSPVSSASAMRQMRDTSCE